MIRNTTTTVTNRNSRAISTGHLLGLVACLALPLALAGVAHAGSVTIDGKVGGLGEGYTDSFDVSFDVEGGPTNVAGGKLFLMETASTLYVGMIVPLTVKDNTYAPKSKDGGAANASDDNRADDWGTIKHNLDKLKGSDKWEVTIDNFVGGNKLELKLDYIEEAVSGTPWTSRIEKFKIGGTDLDKTKIDLATSLEYNYHTLGLTSFFADKNTSSSPEASDGFYDFVGPNQDWVPEFSFEVAFDKSYFASNVGVALTASSFLNTIYPESIFHMSPNKLGGNKVFPNPPVSTVPTPTAVLSGLVLLCGLATRRLRRS